MILRRLYDCLVPSDAVDRIGYVAFKKAYPAASKPPAGEIRTIATFIPISIEYLRDTGLAPDAMGWIEWRVALKDLFPAVRISTTPIVYKTREYGFQERRPPNRFLPPWFRLR